MGQKIHPIGFRLAVTRGWQSKWFAKPQDYATMLKQDIEIRDYVREKLGHASVGRVLIERPSKSARITIYSARPGVVIGKKGEGIENLRKDMQKKLGVAVAVNIEELRKPELDAQIIGDSIAQQLEKRIQFRRAMRRAIQQAMRLGANGIKIACSGRLNGIEIARSEWTREGRVPMHTLRSNIDYALSEAKTTYGIIGIKVWVYRGDSLLPDQQHESQKQQAAAMMEENHPEKEHSRTILRVAKAETENKVAATEGEKTARKVIARKTKKPETASPSAEKTAKEAEGSSEKKAVVKKSPAKAPAKKSAKAEGKADGAQ